MNGTRARTGIGGLAMVSVVLLVSQLWLGLPPGVVV